MTSRHITSTRLGEPGFTLFLHEVYRAGALDRDEWLCWIRLHAAVLRLEPPLSDAEVLAMFERELGATAYPAEMP